MVVLAAVLLCDGAEAASFVMKDAPRSRAITTSVAAEYHQGSSLGGTFGGSVRAFAPAGAPPRSPRDARGFWPPGGPLSGAGDGGGPDAVRRFSKPAACATPRPTAALSGAAAAAGDLAIPLLGPGSPNPDLEVTFAPEADVARGRTSATTRAGGRLGCALWLAPFAGAGSSDASEESTSAIE